MSKSLEKFIQDNSLICIEEKELSFDHLFSLLKNHIKIQHLVFIDCAIKLSHNSYSSFHHNLAFPNPIYSLNLSKNDLGNEGIHTLMRVLSTMTPHPQIPTKAQYLKILNFSNCNIEDKYSEFGIGSLMIVASKQLPYLNELNLSHNFLSTEAIHVIAERWDKGALKACGKLDLSYNRIEMSSFQELISKIKSNVFQLKSFLYIGNSINEIETKEIGDILSLINIHTDYSILERTANIESSTTNEENDPAKVNLSLFGCHQDDLSD